jgi:hypothetical protein
MCEIYLTQIHTFQSKYPIMRRRGTQTQVKNRNINTEDVDALCQVERGR